MKHFTSRFSYKYWGFRPFFSSFLLLFLLAACSRAVPPTSVAGNTAVPTHTLQPTEMKTETAVAATPSITPTSTHTPTLTPAPTFTPIATPETPLRVFVPPTLPPITEEAGNSDELYRLRASSDAEAAALVSLMADYANGFMSNWELYDWYGDLGRQEIIEMGREFILRYPNSTYRTEVEWQMVDASTYFPSRELNELLVNLIAADLNAGIVTLETLDMYLRPHGLQVSLQNCQSCSPFPTSIPNLLGDGREIPLFLIERQTRDIDGAVLIAIWQDADAKFIVTPILTQWAASNRFSGGISNYEARHITGDSQPEILLEVWGHSGSMIGIGLYMYRWDGEKFVELAGTPFGFPGGSLGNQWEFVEGDDPSRLQIISPYYGTTTIYEWTGNTYETVEVTIEDVPPDTTNNYFASEWIERKIGQENYTEVIAYLEEALQSPVREGDHYAMRFILGMNYVYLEDEVMARSVFEALRDETSPPELIGFSQAAEAFLAHYDGLESAYMACSAAYDVLLAAELELVQMTELTSLCAFDKLFVEKLSQYDGIGNVFDYVDAAEIIYTQQHDLNGDGQIDWLLALLHPTLFTQSGVQVWAALQMDEGTEVVRLTTLRSSEEQVEEFITEIHLLPLFDTPMITILSNNTFYLLQLRQGEAGWETKLHINYGVTTDYSLQMVENHLQVNLFFDAATSSEGVDRITYQWDAEMEEFVEMSRHALNSLGVPFSEALDLAETLIFENNDFAAAIPILTAIVDESELTDDFRLGFSLPKALYLLGLAHEMQGNEAEAVAAYWRLWHDHPTDPYALIAAAKLEEK